MFKAISKYLATKNISHILVCADVSYDLSRALLLMAQVIYNDSRMRNPNQLLAVNSSKWQSMIPIYVRRFPGIEEQIKALDPEELKSKSITAFKRSMQ
jgi:hypothetical protein